MVTVKSGIGSLLKFDVPLPSVMNKPPDGVLFDPAGWRTFIDAVKDANAVTHAFIVTDSTAVFQQVVRELPSDVEPVRLYENYLSSFEINTGCVS